jgi:hypothetical protein
MLAREELSRLQARKGELLRQADRDRSAVVAAFQDVLEGTRGVQQIGRLVRSGIRWQAFLLPMALLILPRKARRVFGLVREAAKAFHLAKALSAFWRGTLERR